MTGTAAAPFDYVLVGGGLSNCLLALAVFQHRPAARIALVERAAKLGGNHLWCFHAGDVDAASSFVAPLVTQRWPSYEVRFPRLRRTLLEPYAAVTSERLAAVVERAFAARPSSRLLLSQSAESVGATRVVLASGQALDGDVVIESGGPARFDTSAGAGYQKFLGLELELRRPSPVSTPLLMDALVPQRDGLRFMYGLPLQGQRLLLEDTYFSDSPELQPALLEAEIMAYAERLGCEVTRVVRRESGVLPLPTRVPRWSEPAADAPLVAGYQGGWFNPVTGYSFPVAVRLAQAVAVSEPSRVRHQVWPALLREHRSQFRFGVLLNRLLFSAFAPDERSGAIERFYRLPVASVRRFYAGTLTRTDRLRILCGRPPRGFSLPRVLAAGLRHHEVP